MNSYSQKGRLISGIALAVSIICILASCNLSPSADSVRRLYPAVVKIVAGNRMGSGVIVHSSGRVLTSWHVVAEEKTAYVISSNGVEYEGSVLATNRDKDLALIAIKGNTNQFTCANLGSSMESDDLQIGDAVVIAGYPAYSDSISPIISEGVICAFPTIESVNFIQASAQVYPGSSGGPLINRFGEVIGIVNGKYTNISAGCTTFATAADEAVELMDIVYNPDQSEAGFVNKNTIEQAPSSRICPNVGCIAPAFLLSGLDGEQVSSETYKGRKLLLIFAGNSCPGCSHLMQCVAKIVDIWPRDQLEVMVVVSRESNAEVREWVAANEVKCKVLLDADGQVQDLYRPAALPAVYFIDKYGRIKIKRVDIQDNCAIEIDELLRLF